MGAIHRMKKILVIGVLMIFILAGINSTAIKTSKNNVDDTFSNDRNFYALIIGIEEYAGFDTPDQEYLDDSAISFYEKLLSSSNWEEENIKLLLNENATKESIHDAITGWLDDKENETDVVVIYHVSHGWKTKIKDRLKGNAYVFTHNSSSFMYGPDKITDKEYDNWVDELDSKHIALIFGNCYSGRMLALRQTGRTVLTAGGKYLLCPCNWSMYLEDTMFGFFLRQGLDGVADINNDGWVTAQEAFHYARWPVIWHSTWYHFPYLWDSHGDKQRFLGPQIPYMYDRHVGDIPILQYTT